MDEIKPLTNTTLDTNNVVEFKAAHFSWDIIPDISKKTDNSQHYPKRKSK